MTSERTKLPALASLPVAKSTVTSTSSYLNRMTPGVYITEGVIKPPEHVNDLTEQTKKKCEMAGLDLIDDIVSDMVLSKIARARTSPIRCAGNCKNPGVIRSTSL